MDDNLTLRAFREDDLGSLDRLCTDPAALGPFEWFGFGDVRARRPRWEQDGFVGAQSTALAVVVADGTVAGIASWKATNRGGAPGVLRGVAFRDGTWRDAVIYALLRDDQRGGR